MMWFICDGDSQRMRYAILFCEIRIFRFFVINLTSFTWFLLFSLLLMLHAPKGKRKLRKWSMTTSRFEFQGKITVFSSHFHTTTNQSIGRYQRTWCQLALLEDWMPSFLFISSLLHTYIQITPFRILQLKLIGQNNFSFEMVCGRESGKKGSSRRVISKHRNVHHVQLHVELPVTFWIPRKRNEVREIKKYIYIPQII